jgi:hypothetical protein
MQGHLTTGTFNLLSKTIRSPHWAVRFSQNHRHRRCVLETWRLFHPYRPARSTAPRRHFWLLETNLSNLSRASAACQCTGSYHPVCIDPLRFLSETRGAQPGDSLFPRRAQTRLEMNIKKTLLRRLLRGGSPTRLALRSNPSGCSSIPGRPFLNAVRRFKPGTNLVAIISDAGETSGIQNLEPLRFAGPDYFLATAYVEN